MQGVSNNIITYSDPKSPTSEAIRCLRTNIQFLNAGKKFQVITITSPAPQEGKSIISTNLSVVTAQSNKKTLLIDADMRRPSVAKAFGLRKGPGLSELLAREDIAFEDIPLCDVGVENLKVLPSGRIPPNPAELMERETMDKFLAIVREEFDIIYVDLPPVLSVTDPVIAAKKSDGALLVVMAQSTLSKAVVRSYNILKKAGVNIVGAVLNKVYTGRGSYYYYRYKYYTKR